MISVYTKVDDRSQELIKRTSEAGEKAYKKAGRLASKEIKKGIAVRTGTLKGSIGHQLKTMDGLPILDVGAKKKFKGKTAHHAHLVEDGTGQRKTKSGRPTGSAPAKPFLKNKRNEIQKILEETVREEMKKIEG